MTLLSTFHNMSCHNVQTVMVFININKAVKIGQIHNLQISFSLSGECNVIHKTLHYPRFEAATIKAGTAVYM